MAARMKVRRDDMVKVISGKDRGKTGRVLSVDPKDNKPTRVGIKREDGKRFRVARRSGTQID